MSAIEILLVRHGQSKGNEEGRFGGHGPTPLTRRGKKQAEQTAEALQREGGVSAIYSSDLPRALETAQPIAEAVGTAVIATMALRERSIGIFTGLTFSEAEARDPEAYAALMRREPNHCPPEGETAEACGKRSGELIDELIKRFSTGRILLVSHAFTINLVLRRILGYGTKEPGPFFQTDNCGLHRLKLRHAAPPTVIALNDRAHLIEPLGSSPSLRV